MTGPDAVRCAKAVHEALERDGVVMIKLDGSARAAGAPPVAYARRTPASRRTLPAARQEEIKQELRDLGYVE